MFERRVFIGVAMAIAVILFKFVLCVGVLLAVSSLAIGAAELVVLYDEGVGEFPEGIAIDKYGNIFVSLSILGSIDKITPDGMLSEFAVLDPAVGSPFGVLGLAVDAPGNIYAAVTTWNPDTHGVWRMSRDGQSQELLPGTGQIEFPNSLAFDKIGNLYVTDSAGGAIWRIPPGGAAELWLRDELLGSTPPTCMVRANGIAWRQRELFVANTCESLIVRVPVEKDGSPGVPEILFDGTVPNPAFPFVPDGIALDVHGMIYTVNYTMSQVVRLSPEDGSIEILASAADSDPIDEPASLAFGTGKGDRKNLFITNFARFGVPPQPPDSIGASVVKITLDTRDSLCPRTVLDCFESGSATCKPSVLGKLVDCGLTNGN